jgi:hypothetical protein
MVDATDTQFVRGSPAHCKVIEQVGEIVSSVRLELKQEQHVQNTSLPPLHINTLMSELRVPKCWSSVCEELRTQKTNFI